MDANPDLSSWAGDNATSSCRRHPRASNMLYLEDYLESE